jgi:hypothetical protein
MDAIASMSVQWEKARVFFRKISFSYLEKVYTKSDAFDPFAQEPLETRKGFSPLVQCLNIQKQPKRKSRIISILLYTFALGLLQYILNIF